MKEKPTVLKSIDGSFISKGKNFTFFPSIGLKLTGACRLACPFCCEPNRSQQIFPLNNFRTITNSLFHFGTRKLCLTGGDPLLYPDLIQLLKYSNSLGFENVLLTSDGELFQNKASEIIPFVNAVRFSVHELNSKHDELVGRPGVFKAIEESINILNNNNIPSYITTVLSTLTKDSILDIAEWCFKNKVKRYYLFGILKSGNGNQFISQHGELSNDSIPEMIYDEYKNSADCVLVYGDGRVVIDPYPHNDSFQLEIGNLFSDDRVAILNNFNKDPINFQGHCKHLSISDELKL
jgi:MoaA/NifB/PqqE/SkfB family radical SAM enzyme